MSERFETASTEILRALRAGRSQLAFSRRLGYRSNVVASWETGRRKPSATVFLKACERSGAPTDKAFAAVSSPGEAPRILNDPNPVTAWLAHARGTRTLSELARLHGSSRYRMQRWFAGDTELPLAEFLSLIALLTGRLSDWAAALVPIDKVPSLLTEHAIRQRSKSLAFEEPLVELVLRVVELDAYRARTFVLREHSIRFIADVLEHDFDQAERAVAGLESAEILRWSGNTHETSGNLSVDTTSAPDQPALLRRHWLHVASERAKTPRDSDYFGYNILSCSTEDLARIRDAQKRLYREIRGIVEATRGEEAIALVNINLIEW